MEDQFTVSQKESSFLNFETVFWLAIIDCRGESTDENLKNNQRNLELFAIFKQPNEKQCGPLK